MASSNDKFIKLSPKWVGQIGTGGVDGTTTTIPLASTSGLPTDTAVVAHIDRVDSQGNKTPDKEEVVVGVVSGNNLINCIRGFEGTAQRYSAGAVVEILVSAYGWNRLIDGILAEHSQSGAHTTDTISEKTVDAGVTVDGVKHKDSQVYTDQINEKTTDAGVTVDGLLIKDGNAAKATVLSTTVRASAYVSSDQSISAGSWTKVNFNTVRYNSGGHFDTANKRFVAPVSGFYAVMAHFTTANSTTGYTYMLGIYGNGSRIRTSYAVGYTGKSITLFLGISST